MTAVRTRRPSWLRALQLVGAAWLTLTLLHVALAPPAVADNCSVFTDCFGVAGSAVEAAFGLSLLAVLSLVLDFVPVVGTGKGLVEAATGRDLLTGEELAAWERALGVLPGLGALAVLRQADVLRGADDVAAGARRADAGSDGPVVAAPVPGGPVPGGAGAGGRAGDPPGRDSGGAPPAVPPGTPGGRPRPPLPVGHRSPLDPQHAPLVERYRRGDTRVRHDTAEEIGEWGAVQHLQEASGRDVALLRPTTDGDVTGLVDMVDRGEAWPSAVAYNGRNATNLVWFDGHTLIVVEAKGGGSSYGTRQPIVVTDAAGGLSRISQTHPQYPRDLAASMSTSPLRDGRTLIGDLVEDMYLTDRVEYVGVRTGSRGLLLRGAPDVVLEGRFHSPTPRP